MTYKQIETSREIRMWTTRVIVPGIGFAIYYFSEHPEKWDEAKAKVHEFTEKAKGVFKR